MTDPRTDPLTDAPHPAEPTPAASGPAADADGQITYYEGSPRLRGELGTLFLWTAIGALVLGIPIVLYVYEKIAWWWIAIALPIAIICWVVPSLLVRRNYYRITNYRIDYEHGLLFKNMDTLELWHIEDVNLRQSPLDRIFGLGTITVVSNDATTPRLQLRSIDEPRKLLETLKNRIITVKRQRGVIKLDV